MGLDEKESGWTGNSCQGGKGSPDRVSEKKQKRETTDRDLGGSPSQSAMKKVKRKGASFFWQKGGPPMKGGGTGLRTRESEEYFGAYAGKVSNEDEDSDSFFKGF